MVTRILGLSIRLRNRPTTTMRSSLRLICIHRAGQLLAVTFIASYLLAAPSPANAITEGLSPNEQCAAAGGVAAAIARNMPLQPANGATVAAGTPVTFSGESEHALTFDVASSEALLPSPDIDSGIGAQSGAFYEFTSTKVTATPRTIYWRASFTLPAENCGEGAPAPFTTPVRTLVVTPSEAELAAVRQAEAAAGTVTLDGAVLPVQRYHRAAIVLTCSDVETCTGTLVLTAQTSIRKGKKRRTKVDTIGTGSFSIAADAKTTVEVVLDKTTRTLLSGAHGQLPASLTIRRAAPLPTETQVQSVRLEQRARELGRSG